MIQRLHRAFCLVSVPQNNSGGGDHGGCCNKYIKVHLFSILPAVADSVDSPDAGLGMQLVAKAFDGDGKCVVVYKFTAVRPDAVGELIACQCDTAVGRQQI